jgi:hypothetical protein
MLNGFAIELPPDKNHHVSVPAEPSGNDFANSGRRIQAF